MADEIVRLLGCDELRIYAANPYAANPYVQGQQVDDDYKGITIQNGNKSLQQ